MQTYRHGLCKYVQGRIKQRRSQIQSRDKGRRDRKEKVVHRHGHPQLITSLQIRGGTT